MPITMTPKQNKRLRKKLGEQIVRRETGKGPFKRQRERRRAESERQKVSQ